MKTGLLAFLGAQPVNPGTRLKLLDKNENFLKIITTIGFLLGSVQNDGDVWIPVSFKRYPASTA